MKQRRLQLSMGDLECVDKITKQLGGQIDNLHRTRKEGKMITTEREQAARWVQHSKEVLKQLQAT